jgi:anti-sigma factor RsiW
MTRTTCDELVDSIVDYVDGELPADEAEIVARHLSECPRCRRTADDLERSLGLARIIWQDNLADMAAVGGDAVGAGPRTCPSLEGNQGGVPLRHPSGRTTKPPRRTSFYVLAVAASVVFAAGILMMPVLHQSPKKQIITAEQIEQHVARVGRAAQLLAATRMVAQCEGTESLVQQQYRYILSEYADTPAAESLKASLKLKLGGTQHD